MYELVIFLRLLKFFDLLYEIKTLRVIIETLRNLMRPLADVGGILFVIFYFFGQIGIYSFGGHNTLGSTAVNNDPSVPQFYHLMNFNDFLSAFVTLFALMIVNNWLDIVQVYVDVMGTNWVKWYFIGFYYFSVVVGINIVVAFSIDMYDSVARLDEERSNTVELLRQELEAEAAEEEGSRASGEGKVVRSPIGIGINKFD